MLALLYPDARVKATITRLLDLSFETGPFAVLTNHNDPVHLRQGDMDGACGPYALAMALITMGVIGREELTSLDSVDRRTRLGKFAEGLKSFGTLVSRGTLVEDMQWLADLFKNEGLISYSTAGRTKEIATEAVAAIDEGGAAIVGVEWQGGGGHWMLAVGYQSRRMCDSEPDQLTHILCLDPGEDTPKTSLWNSILHLYLPDGSTVNSGRFPSYQWGMANEETPCRLSEAIILKRPKQNEEFFG